MANYALGDIQGCFKEFKAALKKVEFNPKKDFLWLAGDLINRGPDSLELLEYVYKIKDRVHIVLGNHDLHFLACFYSDRKISKNDTLTKLFASEFCETYADFLVNQPLLFLKEIKSIDGIRKIAMVHAGIPPSLDFDQCIELNHFFQRSLIKNPKKTLNKVFDRSPAILKPNFKKSEKISFFSNALTRIRICKENGKIKFSHKGGLENLPENYDAWFNFPSKFLFEDIELIFGHWAALDGKTNLKNIIGLDTGCVWGRKLTIMRLEDNKKYYIKKIK
mgnify:CR=1 FL=1|jgi:bis(5'-nucleosyl)-tetraphosphatase (symmetrical)|tara:strand:+ start:1253 stop:2083 length:831 start_codon:yes stop_codon:yes gene_type:complete